MESRGEKEREGTRKASEVCVIDWFSLSLCLQFYTFLL